MSSDSLFFYKVSIFPGINLNFYLDVSIIENLLTNQKANFNTNGSYLRFFGQSDTSRLTLLGLNYMQVY